MIKNFCMEMLLHLHRLHILTLLNIFIPLLQKGLVSIFRGKG